MQIESLNNVLIHLRHTFDFTTDETKKFLGMLHQSLTDAVAELQSADPKIIYNKSHKLHSELHICGQEPLSELAAAIELQAKKGIIERHLIDDFIIRSTSFAEEIEQWMMSNE